ncbi:unnamed protein product, partial [Closterium sp. NIES-64]
DKAALIEELEESLQQLQEERANAAFNRRRADLVDELAQAEAATSAAAAAMAQGAGTVTAAAAAAAAAEAVVEGGGAAGGRVELDEFGRDVNLQKRLEFQRRVAARERRHAKAEARRAGRGEAEGGEEVEEVEILTAADAVFADAAEEYSRIERVKERMERWKQQQHPKPLGLPATDSTLSIPPRTLLLPPKMRCLQMQQRNAVFADAAEEYSRIERVKERMERWKQQHPSAYRDAYASMSAPALFAPFVRLELLRWDPLFGGGAFDSMHWYSVLFDYGLPTDGSEPAPDDPDTNLVPRLVEKVGLPILHHALQHCWDPLDRAATNRAVTAVEEVLVYVEAGAPAVVEMVKAVEGRIENAVGEIQEKNHMWPWCGVEEGAGVCGGGGPSRGTAVVEMVKAVEGRMEGAVAEMQKNSCRKPHVAMVSEEVLLLNFEQPLSSPPSVPSFRPLLPSPPSVPSFRPLLPSPSSVPSFRPLLPSSTSLLPNPLATLPAWPPPILAACPSAARFAAQRFGHALRLIYNLGRMRDVVSQQLLDRLVLQSLLANQLLPHLRALAPALHDAVPRTERLVCVLCDGKWAGTGSGSALPPSAEPRNSPRSPLSLLVAYIETLGRSVESRSAVEGQREECVGLARRLKRMLVQMEEMDKARALGKVFGIKEAL